MHAAIGVLTGSWLGRRLQKGCQPHAKVLCGGRQLATFNPLELDALEVYKLLVASVLPRPIAWVSSVSIHGERNIAPFSFFTVASSNPPMVCISIGEPEDRTRNVKDTRKCIEETEEFVVNIATSEMLESVVATAMTLPFEVDEFVVANLTPIASETVAAPRIAESPISLECRLHQLVPLGQDVLVIGRVVRFHFRDGLLDERLHLQVDMLRPLGRLAGPNFCTRFDVVRKAVPAVDTGGDLLEG